MKSVFLKAAIAVVVVALATGAIAYKIGYERGNTAGLKAGIETGWKGGQLAYSLRLSALSNSQKPNSEQLQGAPDKIGHTENALIQAVLLRSGGAVNIRTGEFYPSVAGGVIDPKTGTFYEDMGIGYVDTRTGQFMPKY